MHSCSIIKHPKGVCGILPHLLVKKYTFSKLAEDSFYIMASGLPNLSENYLTFHSQAPRLHQARLLKVNIFSSLRAGRQLGIFAVVGVPKSLQFPQEIIL